MTCRQWMKSLTSLLAICLNRFLVWLFASKNPAIICVREFIRNQRLLLRSARLLIHMLKRLPSLFTAPAVAWDPRISAIAKARSVGGAVTAAELERVWSVAKENARILCFAEGLELEQLEIVLGAARIARGANFTIASIETLETVIGRFSVIIVACASLLQERVVKLEKTFGTKKLLLVGQTGKRSCYLHSAPMLSDAQPGVSVGLDKVHAKLMNGDTLRIVFLNDVGFRYGAGIALRRQAASLLLKGWDVALVAWLPGDDRDPPMVTGIKHFNGWKGIKALRRPAEDDNSPEQATADLIGAIEQLEPDVVITGNLHGSGWPLAALSQLQAIGIRVAAYMHDTYFITGRCAQPLECTLFRTGCDARCPTPSEYPRLAPEKIASAWRERGSIFTGDNSVALVGNSRWTRNVALQRFGTSATTDVVSLALDHELFAPIPKAVARRILKIPDRKIIIAMGAVDVTNQWKGGPLFHGLHKALNARHGVGLVLFGYQSEKLKSLKSFGLVDDERIMPLIMSAADIFVSTAVAESFGQSLLEASACAVPVIALDVGGVSDVVVHNETGVLVQTHSVKDLLEAIDGLIAKPAERERMGGNARKRVLENFTLFHQANGWVDCLKRIC